MPILKKDGLGAGDVKNYRPISNLTFISKLIERLVYSQLFNFLEQHKLLPKFQFGFRKYHSTETAVLKVISDIAMAADAGEVTLLGLLDMSAAFDTVDHSILVNRLETSFGFSGSVLSWLESFLSRRTQQVVFNNTVSDVAEVRTGVPQGSVLGPLLFLLYSADVPLIAACNGLSIHCYADDGQLYFHGKAGESANITTKITNCIEEIDCWMSSNRLKLNSEKTQFIWIGTSQQLNKVPVNAINIGSSSVPIHTTVNNL